jgi:hypothetical protein
MKVSRLFRLVSLFAVCALGGAVLSTVATFAVWNTAIEPRAFHCVDEIGILDSYWCGMDNHKAAGDTVFPGWTWEKLEAVRISFIAAFYFLWAGCALIPFWLLLQRSRRPNNVMEATAG